MNEKEAYSSLFIDNAQLTLGEMFDYAINVAKYDPDEFMDMFIKSEIADGFGKGYAKWHGRGSLELVYDIVKILEDRDIKIIRQEFSWSKSREYWAGWALAYYQWETNQSFEDINKFLPFSDIISMYILHEADISKFVSVANEIRDEHYSSDRRDI